jgi:hypothetical protein
MRVPLESHEFSRYCLPPILLFFIPRLICRRFVPILLLAAMKIKFELDTNKAARATVTIPAFYALGRVSKGTKYPQLAFANSIALIVIITILYSNCLAPLAKKHTPLARK